MTAKEAEHCLIDLGFVYNKQAECWELPGGCPAIADNFLQQHPDEAVRYMAEEVRK